MDMSIMKEAIMFTIDSRASDRRAIEPEMRKAKSLRLKTMKPPITARVADWFLFNDFLLRIFEGSLFPP